ncbi:MAG TPA: hypothetical protein VGI81_25940 [Tepidisphaeraceae bacterium]
MAKRFGKRSLWLTVGLATTVVVYVGSYVAMSAGGQWTWSQSGRLRYSFGLSVTDVIRWQPALAHWEQFYDISGNDTSRGNVMGYLYSPLIQLDRSFVHRDRPAVPGLP